MGQTTSNAVKKLWGNGTPAENDLAVASYKGNPFIRKRWGSQYLDEDCDVAHEFYEEVRVGKQGRRFVMRLRSRKHLKQQGMVDLPHPRLHVDLPIVICEAPR